MKFESRGIGGGGSMFGPSICPFDTERMLVACDMSEAFRSTDGGQQWTIVDARMLQTRPLTLFSYSAPDANGQTACYALNIQKREGDDLDIQPAISLDGGATWSNFPGWSAVWSSTAIPTAIYGDIGTPNHFLVTDGATLASFTWDAALNLQPVIAPKKWPPGQRRRIAGVGFQASVGRLLVATDQEILYYDATTGGAFASLSTDLFGAISQGPYVGEGVISFAVAGAGPGAGGTRLFAITTAPGNIFPTAAPGDFKGVTTTLFYVDWTEGAPTQHWKLLSNLQAGLRPQLVVAAPLVAGLRAYVATFDPQAKGDICAVYHLTNEYPPDAKRIFAPSPSNDEIRTGWAGTRFVPAPSIGASAIQPAATPLYRPDRAQGTFVSFAPPYGLTVAADLGDLSIHHVAITDSAVIHRTAHDGANAPTWQQLYLQRDNPHGSNAEGTKVPGGKYYASAGLELTVCTWLDWLSPTVMRASFNDIGTLVSQDGGETWSFANEYWETPPGFVEGDEFPGDIAQTLHYVDDQGKVYELAVRYHLDPSINTPYGTIESLIDDEFTLDQWTGALHRRYPVGAGNQSGLKPDSGQIPSPPDGVLARWKIVKANFGSPDSSPPPGYRGGVPVWMAIDAKVGRLYVAVAHSVGGGVWYCNDSIPAMGPESTWTRIATTGMHPYNIHILADGEKLLVSQCGHLRARKDASGNPIPGEMVDPKRSGVWIYNRKFKAGGQEIWEEDVDAAGFSSHTSAAYMSSWTQDVVLDPAKPETKWFACVWRMAYKGFARYNKDGASPTFFPEGAPVGTLLRTTDAGANWTAIFPPDQTAGVSVTSCTIHPVTREIFICTRYDGLYYCSSVDSLVAGTEDAVRVDYPFRAPTRVFLSPTDPSDPTTPRQVWIASNGFGLSRMLLEFGVGDRARSERAESRSSVSVVPIMTTRLGRDVLGATEEEIEGLVESTLVRMARDNPMVGGVEDLRVALRRAILQWLDAQRP